MKVPKPTGPGTRRLNQPRAGMQLKTGYKIGLAEQASAQSFQDFRKAGSAPAGSGILIDPTPLLELSRDVLEWLRNWLEERKYQQLKRQGVIIELKDIKPRLIELDFLRGLAISMMLMKHFLDGWARVLAPTFQPLLLSVWTPLATGLVSLVTTFFMASALQNSSLFEKFLSDHAPMLPARSKMLLSIILASMSGIWLGMIGSGLQAYLFLSGMTMVLRSQRGQDRDQLRADFFKQGLRLYGLGLLMTLLSLWLVPGFPIYFGTLHLFGLSTMLVLPFLELPEWAVVASGLAIIAVRSLFTPAVIAFLPGWLLMGLVPLGYRAADYAPLVPFFGCLLLGVAAGRTLFTQDHQPKYKLPDFSHLPLVRGLSWLGRHSLAFYLAQEPLNLAGLATAGLP